MTEAQKSPPASAEIILLPSDRFFVRAVPLAPGTGIGAQVELALEGLAPFPLGQLFYGYLLAPARDTALVFAAFRKRFSAEELSGWNEAVAVLPAFLALLGDAPTTPTIRLWAGARGITALAWDGRGPLPVAVMARETEQPADVAQRMGLVADIRTRTGLVDAAVQEFSGDAAVGINEARETFRLELSGGSSSISVALGRREISTADVRDKEFLAGQRVVLRRNMLLWRSFLACVGGLAAMVVLEAGLLGGGVWLKGIKATVQQQAVAVKKIETAQSLSARIEEMTQRRLMPFEMLVMINQNRPASIQFIRATTTGLNTLEIEAQTANAADVGQYEAVLRASQQIAGVETRDLRSREGVTSFILTVTFRPAPPPKEAGS
jgi:hypothetical protein